MRILIIEDEKLLADSLKALLEQNGFEADAACDGKTGEYYAALGIYDLLILDVMMPGRDGYEVARRLRERRMEFPKVKDTIPKSTLTLLPEHAVVRLLGIECQFLVTS